MNLTNSFNFQPDESIHWGVLAVLNFLIIE